MTSTTTYNENTGQIVEIQTPGANEEAASSSESSFRSVGLVRVLVSCLGRLVWLLICLVMFGLWIRVVIVSRVNSKGEFVREFEYYGSGNGSFASPRGIAVSSGSSGDVYVADTGNDRVQEFNLKGELVRGVWVGGWWEWSFRVLQGVAVDSEGHVWTIESTTLEGLEGYEPRVQELSREGVYISQFGSYGTTNGKFKKPQGIADR